MGKTAKGAVWLDPEKTSPYEFFQYWRNVTDADVIRCMKLITFVPIEEIKEMEHLTGSELNAVKERLAFEVTKLVHGEEEAKNALKRLMRYLVQIALQRICRLPYFPTISLPTEKQDCWIFWLQPVCVLQRVRQDV